MEKNKIVVKNETGHVIETHRLENVEKVVINIKGGEIYIREKGQSFIYTESIELIIA